MNESQPERLPKWLKRQIPKGNHNHLTENMIQILGLSTVCDHAKCPNRIECYANKTATFLILGTTCTRNCRFCSVATGTPAPPDPAEPAGIANAVKKLGLAHVVLTMVSRDDLSDGGAEHFGLCIDAIRRNSSATIEVLPSDFAGNEKSIDLLSDFLPEVYNYNLETVPRLFSSIRGPIPHYRRTLDMFRRIRLRHPEIKLKSGIILGLGETLPELLDMLSELVETGCRRVTIGQYLRPSPDRIPVVKYYTPEEFDRIGDYARRIGFEHIASGAFVRSSYRAAEAIHRSRSGHSVSYDL